MEGSKVIATVPSAGGNYEIIKLGVKEKRVGIFLSPVGVPAAGGLMEDINALTGAENFILFGSCGSLDEKRTKGKYIVVEEAYRGRRTKLPLYSTVRLCFCPHMEGNKGFL